MMDDEEFDGRHYDFEYWEDWDEREKPDYVCSFCGHVTCKGECDYAYEAMWDDHENDSEFDDVWDEDWDEDYPVKEKR